MKKFFAFIGTLLGLSCAKGMNEFESVTKNVGVKEGAYGTQLAKECYEKENRQIEQEELTNKDEENLKCVLSHLATQNGVEIYFSDYERRDKVSTQFSRNCAYPINTCLKNATFKWLKENNFAVKRSKHRKSDCFYWITLPNV